MMELNNFTFHSGKDSGPGVELDNNKDDKTGVEKNFPSVCKLFEPLIVSFQLLCSSAEKLETLIWKLDYVVDVVYQKKRVELFTSKEIKIEKDTPIQIQEKILVEQLLSQVPIHELYNISSLEISIHSDSSTKDDVLKAYSFTVQVFKENENIHKDSNNASKFGAKNTGKKKEKGICFQFQSGECARGSVCKFQHVIDESLKNKDTDRETKEKTLFRKILVPKPTSIHISQLLHM